MSVLKLLDDANTQIFEWLDLLEHGGSVSSTLLPSPQTVTQGVKFIVPPILAQASR